ncbi:hypothetical protein B0J12DRAFT_674744 [Macrophomina phaseolina]|uniref:FAD-binding domain-containing protein n=1 Tax=Macrophomina phaseolina TaxID=35725 RepID=A0ABQ8G1J8_9PEZI|nr:hypothetical protein B0J12DRAFT_674744 [Macrophomina phaseolina]
MADRAFRVVIVGGSIAGLTLALALEKNGIDFLVLEAYPEIAPQVGASIAVLPNGFRILDQLGCYEDMMAKVNCTTDNFIIRDSDGEVLIHVKNLEHHLIQRHGYPMIFFERRMVIEVLYKHIRQKNKVLTSKRVAKVEENVDRVAVVCEDGDRFEGSIVIGADGIHSKVSEEISRAAEAQDPQYKKDDLPVQYRCLFGISEKVPGIAENTLHHVTNEGSSSFAASGPNNRTYWCLFINTGSTYHGQDLPPYDAKDEAETVRKHGNDAITETVKFSDLYDRKLMTVCTPLHEYVLGKWHSQRCMVIGDAVHKFNPIIGLGGMSAMETCAALTNALVALLRAHSGPPASIPASSIAAAFAQTQAVREPRAAALVAVSQQTQYRFAMETPLLRLLNRHYFPALGPRAALRLLSEAYPGAASFDTLPTPQKPRALPYEDELLRVPAARSGTVDVVVGVLVGAMVVGGVYALFAVGRINGAFPLVREAVREGLVPGLGGVALRSVFGAERVPRVDRLLRTLTAVFMPVVAGAAGPESKIQAGYFLISVFLPLLAVLVVEGYRKRNTWSLIWSPSLWTAAGQLFGLGIVLPVYVLAFYSNSKGTAYWMPAERYIPEVTSKALLPSLVVGFLIPSAVMVSLSGIEPYAQEVIAFWQITPMLVVLLTEALSGLLRAIPPTDRKSKAPVEDYQGFDLPHLRRLYGAQFLIAAGVHVAVLASLVVSSTWSVAGVFVPRSPKSPVSTVAAGMAIFFKFDLLLVALATFVWVVLNIIDMRRVGIAAVSLPKAVSVLVVGYIVVGPGATVAAFWKWREEKMARPELKGNETSSEANGDAKPS